MRPGGALRKRWIGAICAVAGGSLIIAGAPLSAAARPGSQHATTAAAAGTVYGGVSAQEFPVVIETSRNRRRVVNATIAIRLTCTSGGVVTLPDRYRNLSVNKRRRFSASFGPTTSRNDDGTMTDFEGTISGAFNRARTKASGRWSFNLTQRDAAGAITDTCESGNVTWTAKQ
jgi:hypothetical protein